MSVRETDLLCHELLLGLADRLPDAFLWRYRDWLDGGAEDMLARSLPAILLRERIGVDDDEHRLLREALLPLGADPAVVDAIPPVRSTARYDFATRPEAGNDHVALVLGATLRGRPGVQEVRGSWRNTATGADERVLLVIASADPIALTGELQRILRALGEPEPRVEVLDPEQRPSGYHTAAIQESVLVCTGVQAAGAAGGRN